jgi:hypothetical protein
MKTFNAYPKDDPGDNGLNNASILTFSKDVIDALIKELAQNSIDAKNKTAPKVKLRVNIFEIDKTTIDGFMGLEEILNNMTDYWSAKKQTDFVKFFQSASDLTQRDKLNVFAFEDFNTYGLEGDDSYGSFKNLIFDEGVSDNKPDNALGGFGIGKNSFFALTNLQTVFYSSKNETEGYKFFGVSKLAEYIDSNGQRRNSRIYYGDWTSGKAKAVIDPNLIPTTFRRGENGLSSFALGVDHNPDWKNLVIKAFIKNYWFLFEKDEIEAEIGDVVLNKDNYWSHANDVFEADDAILAFIETYKKPQFDEEYDVHEIGKIRILLSEEPAGSSITYPDKIVFFRNGMMIKEYDLGKVRNLPNNIAGIIYCENSEGNKILSMMEPPAHDDFQSFYLPKKHPTLTEEDGRKIIRQIENAKTESVKKIKLMYSQPTKQVAFVDELLSGLSLSNGVGNSVGKNTSTKEETFYLGKKEGEKTITVSSNSPNIVFSDSEDPTDKPGPAVTDNPFFKPKDNKPPKEKRKIRPKKPNSIDRAKVYFSHEDSGFNYYNLIIQTASNIDHASIKLTQHGDSPSKALTTDLIQVSNGSSTFKFLNNGSHYEIFGLALKSGLSNVFQLKFKENFKSAFKILN